MKYKFIINPTAGKGRAKKIWSQLQPKLTREQFEFDWSFTKQQGHAQQLASQTARENNYDAVISVGGDGTTWEIINGLVNTNLSLGIIPAGSGNDLAKSFNRSVNPTNVCNLLTKPDFIQLQLGQANDKFFLNLAGIGFDAEIAANVNHNYHHLGGRLPYFLSILKKLITFTGIKMEIKTKEKTLRGQYLLVAVALNGQSFGGGIKITPDNDYTKPQFTICAVEKLPRWEILRMLPAVYHGQHLNHPAVHSLKSKQITITATPSVFVQTDGELIGTTPFTFTVTAKQIPLLI